MVLNRKPIKLECPDIPAALSNGLPPPGSVQWCVWTEEFLLFAEKVGEVVGTWLVENIDPTKVRNAIANYHNAIRPGLPGSWWATIKLFLRFVIDNIDMMMNAWEAINQVIRCAWNWNKVLFPKKNPGAYLGLLVMRNILHTFKHMEIGPDIFAKITAAVTVEIPALEQIIDHLLNYLVAIEVPSAELATEAWTRDYINKEQRDCVWRWWGHDPETYSQYALVSSERLGAREAMQVARRLGGGDGMEKAWLRKAGFTDDDWLSAFRLSYDELPSISDHLHWLQRNVFDDAYTTRYQLAEGFEDRFWDKFGKQLDAQGYTKERARYEYMAHWIQPSPEQMREMVYRLRPGAPGVTNPFDADDFERILAEQDYSILARKWFRQTLYRVPALTYIRDMYNADIITDAQLKAYHQDLGYKPEDAQHFLDVDRIKRYQYRTAKYALYTPRAIGKAHAVGLLTTQAADDMMQAQGATQVEAFELRQRSASDLQYSIIVRARSKVMTTTIQQVRNALKVGVITVQQATATLTALGWQPQHAQGLAQLEDANARVDRVKHAVTHLRGAYLRGEVTADFARTGLQQLGIIPVAIASYMSAWAIEQTPHRKRRTAGQIAKDVAEGLISLEDATARLLNLGYDNADVVLWLAEARRNIVNTEATRLAAHQLGGRERDAELARVAHAAEGLSKRTVAELKAQAPPSKISEYLKIGLVGPEYARNRLRLYGWQPQEIELWIAAAMGTNNGTVAQAPSEEDNAPEGG